MPNTACSNQRRPAYFARAALWFAHHSSRLWSVGCSGFLHDSLFGEMLQKHSKCIHRRHRSEWTSSSAVVARDVVGENGFLVRLYCTQVSHSHFPRNFSGTFEAASVSFDSACKPTWASRRCYSLSCDEPRMVACPVDLRAIMLTASGSESIDIVLGCTRSSTNSPFTCGAVATIGSISIIEVQSVMVNTINPYSPVHD